MRWIQTNTGKKPENKAQLEVIPHGPYYLIDQHEMTKWEANESVSYVKTEVFRTEWGRATYVIGDNGPILIGYHYDTSD
jgi:hypothetical protein